MNIPERLWGATYGELTEILKTPIRRYVADIDNMLAKGTGFWIYGEPGSGKTCGGVVLLKAAWEKRRVGYFTTVKELRISIKENTDFDSTESVQSRARNADVLVLDDLALDDFKNYTFGIGDIEHLLNVRSMRGKTTVLSTRLDPDAFRDQYPSMLLTMKGTFHAIQLPAYDRKAEAAAELRKKLGG
jgi:DNA replication protein DnaC